MFPYYSFNDIFLLKVTASQDKKLTVTLSQLYENAFICKLLIKPVPYFQTRIM